MPDQTPSPTKVQTNLSPTFAAAPLHQLLTMPVHEMTEEQLREATTRLRPLRTSQQALKRELRAEEGTEKKTKSSKAPAKEISVDDYLADLD